MIKVIIKKDWNFFFLYKCLFKKILKTIIKHEKINKRVEVNVIIVNNKKMQKICKKYKKKNQETDVLSFQNDWKNLSQFIGYIMLGDIFISRDKVISQAKKYNHSTKREWCYLFTHGVLHLLGYDHLNTKDEKIMNSLASLIMDEIKVGR